MSEAIGRWWEDRRHRRDAMHAAKLTERQEAQKADEAAKVVDALVREAAPAADIEEAKRISKTTENAAAQARLAVEVLAKEKASRWEPPFRWTTLLWIMGVASMLLAIGYVGSAMLLKSPADWAKYGEKDLIDFYLHEADRFRNHYLVYATIAYTAYGVVLIATTLVASGIFDKVVGQVLAAAAAIISTVIATTGPDKVATNFERAHASMMIAITDAGKNPDDKKMAAIQKAYSEAKQQTTFGVSLKDPK